jgi:VanZ family protein
MNPADSGERHPATRAVARVVLTLYGISLAMIALWPVPVDSGAGGFLRRVTNLVPVLTYARIEFSANIVLFVPLGVLLMLILRGRYLILPIAFVVTVAIECSQALMLDKRTPSVLDIIANIAGACIGMVIVAVAESLRGRSLAASSPGVDADADPWAALGIGPPPPLPSAHSSEQSRV